MHVEKKKSSRFLFVVHINKKNSSDAEIISLVIR